MDDEVCDVLYYDTFGIIAVKIKSVYNNWGRYYINRDITAYVIRLYDLNLNLICDEIDSRDYYYKEYRECDAFKIRLKPVIKSLLNKDTSAKMQISFGYDATKRHRYNRYFVDLKDQDININNIFVVKAENIGKKIIFDDRVIVKYERDIPLISTLISMLLKEYFIPIELQDIIIGLFADLSHVNLIL